MALIIRDNKIMTEEEAMNDTIAGCFAKSLVAGMVIVIAIWLLTRIVIYSSLFVFSPGVLIMSLVSTFTDLSMGQLWVFSIIVSLVIGLYLFIHSKKQSIQIYLGVAVLCSCILFFGCLSSSSSTPNFIKKTIAVMTSKALDSTALDKPS